VYAAAMTSLASASYDPRSEIYSSVSWRIENEYEGFTTEETPSEIVDHGHKSLAMRSSTA